MDFRTVIETRRSIRNYRTDAIPEAVLQRIREAVRLAPTANNRQPFRVLFVRNPALRAEIAGKGCHQPFLAQVPVLCVVCCRKGAEFDAAIATDHLVLAATAEGLGSCWVGWFERDAVMQAVSMPEGMEPCILIPLGYAAEQPDARPRKALEEVTAFVD